MRLVVSSPKLNLKYITGLLLLGLVCTRCRKVHEAREGVANDVMPVFNRWGQLVFETTNLNGRGWDGRLNGQAQPMGVYLYRIEADFSNGRQEHYEGNVTLLR